MQRDHAEPVVQVFAERPGGNGLLKVFVRRGDDPHIHLDGPRAAHALEGLLLKDAEDLGLRLQAHVPDFVEEQRAVVRHFEASGPGPDPRW